MMQGMEECEVFEIDAEESNAGSVVDFHDPTRPVRHSIPRPFDSVVEILFQAGWMRAKAAYDEAGNRVWYLRRQRQPDRPIDDTLDVLRL